MLNQSRFLRTLDAQTPTAKKVFDAVPAADVWTANQIVSELGRTGKFLDFKIASGCLDTLVRAGLIREVGKGKFVREQVRIKPPVEKNNEPQEKVAMPSIQIPQAPPAPKPASPLAELASLATDLRSLSKAAFDIAKKVEDVALEIEAQNESGNAELQKLRQLQSLLKSIGSEA